MPCLFRKSAVVNPPMPAPMMIAFIRIPWLSHLPLHVQFSRLLLRPPFRGHQRRVDGRQILVAPNGHIRENRCVVRTDACSLPAQSVFDFTSVDTQIAEHVVIHFGEFGHGATEYQFSLDRPLHARQERNKLARLGSEQ